MTTIAITREAMAADTRVITGGSFYHANKIFRIGQSLVGTAGDGFACLAFVEWFKSPRRNPQVLHKMFGDTDRDEIIVAELNPSGIHLWNGWGYPEKINDPYYAIGSGGMVALEALRNGADPDDAVRRAVAHDEATGAPVQLEYLLPPELTKRKRRGK
jgi:20S proteasome alpha/beta subunit